MKKYKIFSYGTFQDDNIKKIIFGRDIKGRKAKILGYKKASDSTPYLFISKDDKKNVEGQIFDVTIEELFKCDQWESVPMYKKYKMIAVTNDGEKEEVIVYNKKPIGEIIEINKSSSIIKEEGSDKFLNEVKRFSKKISLKTHNFHFGDIIVMTPFSVKNSIEKTFSKYFNDKEYLEDTNLIIKNTFDGELNKNFDYDDYALFVLNLKLFHENFWLDAKLIIKKFNSKNEHFCFMYLQFLNITINIDTFCENIFNNSSKIKIKLKNGWSESISISEFYKNNSIREIVTPKFFIYSYKKLDKDLMLNISVSQSNKKVVEKDLNNQVETNIANYYSAEIYATQQAIFEFPLEYNPYYIKRMEYQFLTLFIYEMLMYKKVLNLEIVEEFKRFWKLHKKLPNNEYGIENSLEEIKFIYRKNKEISEFINDDLFIYPSAKKLLNKLFPIMGLKNIIELRKKLDYDIKKIENEFNIKKEKISEIKKEKKEKWLKTFALIISLTSSTGLTIGLLNDVFNLNLKMSTLIIFILIIFIIFLVLVFLYTDKKKKQKEEKRQIKEYEFEKDNIK